MAEGCEIMSVVYWENPAKTGSIFLPPFLILSALMYCSLITVVAYTGLIVITVVVGVRVFGIVMERLGKPNPIANHVNQISQVNVTVSPEGVERTVTTLVANTNRTTSHIKSVLLIEDVIETLKFGALCYLLTFIGSMMNSLTLLVAIWVLGFTLPKIYLNNQAMADELYGKVMVQVNKVKEKVQPSPLKQE